MEIKLFSFIKGEAAAFAGSKKVIAECVNTFTSTEEKFKNFSSPKRMLLSASQAMRSADAVVLAVQASAYNSVKKMICSAFEMETEQIEDIYVKLLPLYEKKKITKAAFENNTTFPAEADIFAVSDFKCCGFAITESGQSIIVIPLDEVKTNEVVFGSLYDFINELTGAGSTEDISKLKCARLAAKSAAMLKKSGSKLAFASLGGVQLIEESISFADADESTMYIAGKPEARRVSQTVQDYIVSVAQKTRTQEKTDFACAVSSAFASNTDDSTFIYMAVADEDKTFVKKLFAKKDEQPKQLYRAAVEEAMLACTNSISTGIEAKREGNRGADKRLRQKIAFITTAAVAGATCICAVLSLLL